MNMDTDSSAAWACLGALLVVTTAACAVPTTHDEEALGLNRTALSVPATSSLEAATYPGTSLGLSAFSANGRIQPHGVATSYYFEYGATTTYGQRTSSKPMPPRLTAHYREAWDTGLGGWRGGTGDDLSFVPSGGVSGGGFARFAEPSATDYNHVDGIGIVHLAQYWYPGIFDLDSPTGALGGSDPDLRDAKVHMFVRGNDWQPHGAELLWWSQSDIDHGATPPDDLLFRYSNWGHTGFLLTDALLSGSWERVDYRLYNDTTAWTYAGTNREMNAVNDRSIYFYTPLDDSLGHLDIDFFHLLAFVDPYDPPEGSIDFNDFELTYRNHSLLVPSNGGRLRTSPPGSLDDPANLTDGWRNGTGRMWKSAASPKAPLELVYDFERPVIIDRVQLHQHPEWPSKDVEVLVSNDSGATWTPIVHDVIPESHPAGPNFTYLLKPTAALAEPDFDAPAQKLKVRILSGYRSGHWGLGEIEVFGRGAVMLPDDDWYRLNADITDLVPGQTYHYRIAAVSDGTTVVGEDRTFTVPATAKPEVTTGPATRIAPSSAKVEGRLNTLGAEASVYFEYGTDATYGATTEPKVAGPEITPRTFVGVLTGLAPGTTYHYRLVAVGAEGTTFGDDLRFVTSSTTSTL